MRLAPDMTSLDLFTELEKVEVQQTRQLLWLFGDHCFNAWGLLYESVFDALLFSSSYRPGGKHVFHHVVTRPIFSLSFLDHHTGHLARHDAWILLYECVLDAL
jgi:hypothetical protein